jgi:PAS domain S-box-containing protein
VKSAEPPDLGDRALQDCEEKYRLLLDEVQDYAIFMLDPQGIVVSWNAGAERIKGYKADEIIGHHFSCFFPPGDVARGRPEEVLRLTGERGRHEEQGMRVRKDGSRFLASVTQPKINLKTGEITGAEALLRWTHPIRGLVSPAEFIPVAEDSGLLLPIGRWVLREACKQARSWLNAGLPLPSVAVNISAMQFRDAGFLDGAFAILKETGLDPRYLELELTESVLMKRAESAASVLQALRGRGVQVAVDDFGTGYSSLSYLRKFPIDALKIDQSFVRQITTTPDDTSIVTAVISMGRSLKLRVIAEGVETQEEMEFLQALHCDEAHGYYFGRPVAASKFAELLKTGISLAADFVHG